MKNTITQFARIFVGVLFIISGLIKLNDPIGFSYKLAEYFSEPVFNLPFLEPLSLALALFLVVLEVVLGVMLLLGYRSRMTIKLLLGLIVMFTFLTFYSAFFDVVKDCGCFGDALHLTPWQSFTKDLILLILILILFVNQNFVKPLFNNKIQNILVGVSLLSSVFMGYWVLNHLPIIDFRPYKIGNNIQQGMKIPADAPKSVVEMIFIYNVNGVNTEFKEADLMSLPEGATFVDRKDKIITQGYQPPIHDFAMMKDGADHTQEFLMLPKVLVFVAYDLDKADDRTLNQLTELNALAEDKGYKVLGLTGSSIEAIQAATKKHQFEFDFYYCDATTLKTIERGNPSLVVLNYGTIAQKWHYNDIDKLKL